ncbi:unnamed protein product [Rotaria sp. Silwood2]|nr:unnamed protein product [Rotaria sp. Silwood2]CAF4135093.1 unnamed protein product [Rotaria sp. Silwood2]
MPKLDLCITLDEVWEKLLHGIEHLLQFQTIRHSKWMLLYTYIFDYCTHDVSHNAELYERLKDYLRNYLNNLCQSNANLLDQEILEFYMNQWKKYCISFISYINRHAPTSDNSSQILDVYREYFENQFFQDTQEFYRLEATTYLQHHSIMDYLLKIPEYFDEEVHRVTAYLHPSSIKNLEKKLDEVLIHDQLTAIYEEAKKLIHDERIQGTMIVLFFERKIINSRLFLELNLLYQTVNRIENGKNELINMMENHIYQIGIETIGCINPISTNDLRIYIQTIYDFHQKYYTFIEKAFDSNQAFFDVFNRACRKFINNNAVIQTIGTTISMAQHLARNCDQLLRKKKEEIDLEIIFNQIKILLYYMQDKDVFVQFYSKLFAKRLINQISISNDYEQLMISNIEVACGFEFAYKMKQMYQDIETSKTILDQYHRYCETEQFISKINFSVMILKANVWLFSTPLNIILPNKLQCIVNNFNKFYKHIHNGRKLTWIYQHSKGELQTFFTDQVYTLQVSMYQMIILLLFNNALEWTLEKIQDETQIKIDLLLPLLNTLVESKILTSTQSLDPANLDMNCIIKLSNDFRSDKYRINLNAIIRSVEERDGETFHNKIDQDRIMTIRATIVRITKLHKTINENLLVEIVLQQLFSYFNPNVSTIKVTIVVC